MPGAGVRYERNHPAGSRHARLVDIDEAAGRLGVPVRFMRRLVAERRITHHKIGRYVRFDVDTLDEWVAERTVPARHR